MQGKRLVQLIVVLFVLAAIGTSFFAWRIVGRVKDDAKVTSARLRLVADAVVHYAREQRAFPLSAEELLAGQTESSRAAIMVALETVRVEWSIDRSVQPILRVDGKPTEVGALPEAASSLSDAAVEIRASDPPSQS